MTTVHGRIQMDFAGIKSVFRIWLVPMRIKESGKKKFPKKTLLWVTILQSHKKFNLQSKSIIRKAIKNQVFAKQSIFSIKKKVKRRN